MKITSITTYRLRHRLPKAIGVSTFMYDLRETLLVKIATDEGLFGWGETAALGGVQGMIDEQLSAVLIGQDPVRHRQLWRQLWGPNFGNGLAVGAVDMALHDLWGKARGLPVAELYGGRLRDRVPAYASAMNYTAGLEPEQQYPEEAADLAARGFRAMKMRIGGLPPARDLAAAEAVRAAVGPDVKLMADGNGGYTLATALQLGAELARLGFYWFEEPLPEAHYTGYETLTAKSEIAIAAGEALDSRGTAKELIARRAMDIIQPDVSLCGGITECLFVAEMARAWGIRCMPHCWGGAVTLAATLQVLSLLPDDTWGRASDTPLLELDVYENPFRDRIVKKPFELRDGCVDIPTTPGLGIAIDEETLAHYQRALS